MKKFRITIVPPAGKPREYVLEATSANKDDTNGRTFIKFLHPGRRLHTEVVIGAGHTAILEDITDEENTTQETR